MRLRSHARQAGVAPSASHARGSASLPNLAVASSGSSTHWEGGGVDAVGTSRHARQRQAAPGPLLMLPPELLEQIFSDMSSWPYLHRTCKQLHEWVSAQAAAGWSSKVKTRLYLCSDYKWWHSQCHYYGQWQWMQHPHAPTYFMVHKQPYFPGQLELAALLESGQVDSDRVRSIASRHGQEVQLHITTPPPRPSWPSRGPTQPVYVQSWLGFFLNPQQATPAVAACFSHITIIRLQKVRLTHPLPDCIGSMCISLQKYVLQDVVWPEQLQPGKPWPQLQHLSFDTASTAQLPQLINSSTLPGLQGLYINGWPLESRSRNQASVRSVAACTKTFSNQLTTLVLCYHQSQHAIFTGSVAKPVFLHLTHVEWPSKVKSVHLQSLVAAAPLLQQLKVRTLQLSRNHAKEQCRLQRLEAERMPQFVTTLARLPRMPELKQFVVGCYVVNEQSVNADQVAAAVAAVGSLPTVGHPVTVKLKHKDRTPSHYQPLTDADLLQHMQTLGPLLRALDQKSAVTVVHREHLTQDQLQALGATAVPRCQFHGCSTNTPGILRRLWRLMPDTHEVAWKPDIQQSAKVDGTLALSLQCNTPSDCGHFMVHSRTEAGHPDCSCG